MPDKLNTQWRGQLAAIGSVFQNYMLVGTQWGASTTATPNPKVAIGGVPNFLSNSVVETYLQNAADPKNPFNNGSCITCHNSATLVVNNTTPANLSFLPDLVNLLQVRRPPTGKPGHDAFQGPPPVLVLSCVCWCGVSRSLDAGRQPRRRRTSARGRKPSSPKSCAMPISSATERAAIFFITWLR